MRYRGEITVFLSLTLICVLSLVLGLVESARTAGARLYLRMASDSAVSSVMSYYNRNLWDRYQLLFLEYESEEAIKETFGRYLDFYLEQANMYPARRENVTLSGMSRMVDENGRWLEEEMETAFRQRKELALRKGEEASTKLLIPMFLMLGVVMVMVVAPAFLSL